MTALFVLPFLDKRLAHASLVSLDDKRATVYPWDNTTINAGVTVPWATAAKRVLVENYDWLVVWSTAIVFGHSGGRDFLNALEDPECYATHPGVPRIVSGIGCGWHLTAIHNTVLERVGLFDSSAFFAYYEDSDWIYRHTLSGLGNLWVDGNVQVPVDISVNRGDAHSIHRGLAKPNLRDASAAYIRKWGGLQQRERFVHPYDNPAWDWTYIGPPPGDE